MDEQQLILEAQAGNNNALAELIKKYEKTVYSFAFKVCRNPEKAQNIMQETFMSMVKSLKQFDGKSKLSTWLYRITVNHCLMEYRKRKREFVSFDDDDALINESSIADWDSIPSLSIENKELKKRIKELTFSRDVWKEKYMNKKIEMIDLKKKVEVVKKKVQQIMNI